MLPGQQLGADEQHRFAARLGRPEPHPVTRFLGGEQTIVRIDNELIAPPDLAAKPHLDPLAAHGAWHTDYTFHREIPTFATLRAERVPPVGGDTLWASMHAAFEALSPRMQGWLLDLRALHWHGPHFARNFGIEKNRPEAVAPATRAPTRARSGRAGLLR